jgi:hypothetical protein
MPGRSSCLTAGGSSFSRKAKVDPRTRDASPMVEGLTYNSSNGRGAFAVSANGVLVYRQGIVALFEVDPIAEHDRAVERARRGSEQYPATNSRIAWSYVRWPLAEVKLLRTAAFDCSRSGRARTRFGAFLLRILAVNLRIGDGLHSVAGSLPQIRRCGVCH